MLKCQPYNASVAVSAKSASVKYRLVKYPGSAQFNIVDNTPVAKLFASTAVDTSADTATITAHGFNTGLAGQLTTSGGLPAGLATSTTYYLIVVNANTVKFASSAANALAGTAIDLTTQGTGNDTFTPTALSVVVKLQVSDDDVDANYTDLSGATATVTTSGTSFIAVAAIGAAFIRGVITVTTGYPSVQMIVTGKEASL